ncbi:alpha/beta hydrolase [Hymenobacter bucti]|uniref:Alpha/beta hydrolase n=1 Tax=Hymenobacter bucti TaxID=1844114 RepID=A0ABW4R151_9BACT
MTPLSRIAASILTAGLLTVASTLTAQAQTAPAGIRNILLVHGAFADGSGWQGVYDILVKDGYTVSLVQEPLTSQVEDVVAVKRMLARQTGPSILVGHSYGGAVITEAGTDARVAGLVYIAAHAPDAGESPTSNKNKMPGATKAVAATPDGFLFIDPAHFAADFAADLPPAQAAFMAHAQMPAAVVAMTAPISVPAWKTKPSWYLVAGADHMINPDLERMYATRAHSHQVEIAGASHSVYISHAKEVAALIEEAAKQASK